MHRLQAAWLVFAPLPTIAYSFILLNNLLLIVGNMRCQLSLVGSATQHRLDDIPACLGAGPMSSNNALKQMVSVPV